MILTDDYFPFNRYLKQTKISLRNRFSKSNLSDMDHIHTTPSRLTFLIGVCI